MDTHIPVDQMDFTQAQARYMYKALHEASRLESLRYLLEGVIHTVDAMQIPTTASTDTPVTDSTWSTLDDIALTELNQQMEYVRTYLDKYHIGKPGTDMIEALLSDAIQLRSQLTSVQAELEQIRQAYARLDDDYLARGKEVKELRQAIKDCQVVLTIGGSEYDHIALLDIETILNKVSGND